MMGDTTSGAGGATAPRSRPQPQTPKFGEILRRARERAGLSQVALAGDELHPSYVSLLESGRRTPTSSVVHLLAARLGMSPGELAGGEHSSLQEQLVLADAALATGRPADAVAILEPVIPSIAPDRLSTDTEAFRACELYATALERVGRLDEATEAGERLREAAQTAPARLPWLPVTVTLVRCYREAGDLGRAIDLGEAALQRYRELRLDGLDGHAALVSTLAGVYSERGDHLRAKTILSTLLDDVERRASAPDDRAYAYWNAAINAAERGHVGEGRRLAERAHALLSEGEDARSYARLEVTRGWLLLAETPPDAVAARRILRSALPRLRQHAGTLSVASAETELARCELLLGRPDSAVRVARSALKHLGPEHRVERARALTALGAALISSGETAAGVAELEQAADALAAQDSPRQAAAVWRQLSAVFRAIGDHAWALQAADRAMDAVGLANEPVVAATASVDARAAVSPSAQSSSV